MFKTEPDRSASLILSSLWTILGLLLIALIGTWHRTDERLNDWIARVAVHRGFAPASSPRICYLFITDTTYARFNKQALNREQLAHANDILADLGAESIVYDLILARPGDPNADAAFARSLERTKIVFLPSGFAARKRKPVDPGALEVQESGRGGAPIALHEIASLPDFAHRARGGGHVFAPSDSDGVYRRMNLFVQDGRRIIPGLALSVLLFQRHQTLADIEIHWEDEVRIPATTSAPELIIPIDAAGATRIAYTAKWGRDFESMTIDDLIAGYEDPDKRGNLINMFEGRTVFIGDTSTGIADAGATPLENDVPLVAMHAALLSSMMDQHSFGVWKPVHVWALFTVCCILLVFSSTLRRAGSLHITAVLLLIALWILPFLGYYRYTLFPGATMLAMFVLVYLGTTVSIQVRAWKQNVIIRAENSFLHRDLSIAANIQSKMLPAALPDRSDLEIAAVNIQAQSIGGDFYDVITLPSGKVLLLAGDVSGKGIPAALNMSGILSSFRTIVATGAVSTPREILLHLNDVLIKQIRPGELTSFATAVLLLIDPVEMNVQMARCGHELPIFWNPGNREMREIKTSGFMLGVSPSSMMSGVLNETSVQLARGDAIYIYSDGVTEAANVDGEFYGLSRLKSAIRAFGSGPAQELLDVLLSDIRAFSGTAPQHDDITLVIVRMLGP